MLMEKLIKKIEKVIDYSADLFLEIVGYAFPAAVVGMIFFYEDKGDLIFIAIVTVIILAIVNTHIKRKLRRQIK